MAVLHYILEQKLESRLKDRYFLGSICWRIISLLDYIREYSCRFVSVSWKYLPGCWILSIDLTCLISTPETISKDIEHLVMSIMFSISSRILFSVLKSISLLNGMVFLLYWQTSFWIQVGFFPGKSCKDGIQYSWEDHINDLYNNIRFSLPLLQKIHFTSVKTAFTFSIASWML